VTAPADSGEGPAAPARLPPRLRVANQGKAVAEETDDGWPVMTPDGAVDRAADERKMTAWFRRRFRGADIGAGSIEWRPLGDGAPSP
jgi:hypothetical protein